MVNLTFILVVLVIFTAGCSTTNKQAVKMPEQWGADPVFLQLKPQAGQVEVASNCYVAITKKFVKGELRNKRIEATDFKTKLITLKSDKQATIQQILTTFYKDGGAQLNDLALPELNEQIDFILQPNGKILKAAQYPQDSLFFVPSLPLPSKAVKVGDEWELESAWRDLSTKMKFSSKIKAKLKGYSTCGEHLCAEIVFEGKMAVPEELRKAMGFEHKLTGRFLFDPKLGLVPFALFEADEQLQGKEAQVVVKSRLRSHLLQPQGYHTANHEEQVCPSVAMEE